MSTAHGNNIPPPHPHPPAGPPPSRQSIRLRRHRERQRVAVAARAPYDVFKHIGKFRRKDAVDDGSDKSNLCEVLQRIMGIPPELQNLILNQLTLHSLYGGPQTSLVRIDKSYLFPLGLHLDRHHREAFGKAYYNGNMVFEFPSDMSIPVSAEHPLISLSRYPIRQKWLKSLTFEHRNMITNIRLELPYQYLADWHLDPRAPSAEFFREKMEAFRKAWKAEMVVSAARLAVQVGYMDEGFGLCETLVLREGDSKDEFWARYVEIEIKGRMGGMENGRKRSIR